jgi:hypothetical protein
MRATRGLLSTCLTKPATGMSRVRSSRVSWNRTDPPRVEYRQESPRQGTQERTPPVSEFISLHGYGYSSRTHRSACLAAGKWLTGARRSRPAWPTQGVFSTGKADDVSTNKSRLLNLRRRNPRAISAAAEGIFRRTRAATGQGAAGPAAGGGVMNYESQAGSVGVAMARNPRPLRHCWRQCRPLRALRAKVGGQ